MASPTGIAKSARDASGIGVRVAGRRDALRIGEFLRRAWKEAGPGALGFTGATDSAIDAIASEEFLTKRLTSPNTKIIVAEDGGRVLGFASLRRVTAVVAELSGIVVLQSETGKGIGTRLVRKAGVAAAKMGFREMTVSTETFNARAIAFYRDCGFVESGKTNQKVGRRMVPLQLLEKRLR